MYLAYSIYFLWLMFYEYATNKKNNKLLIFSCVLIAILASIRYQIGTDYDSYFSLFRSLLQDPNSKPEIEIGWRYITYSLSFLGFNEYGCFAFWGSVTVLLLYYGLKKHAAFPLIGCGIFFFAYTVGALFNGMRQILVCVIIIASLNVILERKHGKAICIFLIALSIHKIAIILIPLYLLVMYDPVVGKHKYWILFAALCIGIGGYCIRLMLFSLDYMPSGAIAHSIDFNLNSEDLAQREWHWLGITKRVMLVLIVLYLSDKVKDKWRYSCIAVPLYYWGNVIALLLLSHLTIASRTCLVVKILDLLILPSFLLVSDSPQWKRVIMAAIIIWCLYAFYGTLFTRVDVETVYPFKTIFDSV